MFPDGILGNLLISGGYRLNKSSMMVLGCFVTLQPSVREYGAPQDVEQVQPA